MSGSDVSLGFLIIGGIIAVSLGDTVVAPLIAGVLGAAIVYNALQLYGGSRTVDPFGVPTN